MWTIHFWHVNSSARVYSDSFLLHVSRDSFVQFDKHDSSGYSFFPSHLHRLAVQPRIRWPSFPPASLRERESYLRLRFPLRATIWKTREKKILQVALSRLNCLFVRKSSWTGSTWLGAASKHAEIVGLKPPKHPENTNVSQLEWSFTSRTAFFFGCLNIPFRKPSVSWMKMKSHFWGGRPAQFEKRPTWVEGEGLMGKKTLKKRLCFKKDLSFELI